jgi:hypothetical protein
VTAVACLRTDVKMETIDEFANKPEPEKPFKNRAEMRKAFKRLPREAKEQFFKSRSRTVKKSPVAKKPKGEE